MTTDATEPTPHARGECCTEAERLADEQVEHLAAENARLRQQRDEAREIVDVWKQRAHDENERRYAAEHRQRAAEERYRQLAGEVEKVRTRCIGEGRRAVAAGSPITAAAWESRALELRHALAATAPTDTPTPPLPDWERELLERQAADEAEAAQGESGLSTGKVGNGGGRGWKIPVHDLGGGRSEFSVVWDGEKYVDISNNAEYIAEEVRRLTAKLVAISGSPLAADTTQEGRSDALMLIYDATETPPWSQPEDVVAKIDQLRADLVRVTQERDEARRDLASVERWADLTCTRHEIPVDVDSLTFRLGALADWMRDRVSNLETAAAVKRELASKARDAVAERDALQATLDAARSELDVTRRHAAKWRDIARRDGAALEDDLRAKVREIAEDMEDVGVALDDMTIWAERLRAFDSVPTQTDRSVP